MDDGPAGLPKPPHELDLFVIEEETIVKELVAAQGKPVDLGGYYQPDDAKATAALRPSQTLNDILATL